MNAKNLCVFFLVFASVLLIATSLTSAATNIATIDAVKIDDIYASGNEVAVVAGETITVKVFFTALENAADVKVKLELEGQKIDVDAVTSSFNIEEGKKYSKTLTLTIPHELQNEVSEDLTLDIKIWNGDFRLEDNSIVLRVQRPSYDVSVMSIDTAQTVEAGQILPVDVVLKNTGYNNLDDLYVSVKIPALGIERTSYFGDLVSVETNNDDDTEVKRIFVEIPFGAKAGSYAVDVKVSNSDLVISKTKQIEVKNDFSSNTVAVDMKKSVAVGGKGEFELFVSNPTNKLKVFRIVTESNGDLTTSSDVQLVSVPAGTTKVITITANPHAKGEYDFDVSVFSGEELVDKVTLSVYASGRTSSGNSIVALTIILAIIFLVLLGVLFALLRKKPEQTEEFGESYY